MIEALALEKACVVSDADGNRDLIVNNKNGFVIKEENSNQFANAILELLEDDKKREQFEENSLQRPGKDRDPDYPALPSAGRNSDTARISLQMPKGSSWASD